MRMSIAVVLIGCGTDPSVVPTPPATPTIVGAARTLHWASDGSFTIVPDSPDALFVEADLPDGIVPATVGDDGRFTIEAAPSGPYWLRVVRGRRDLYVLTDATSIDLAADVVGLDGGLAQSPDTAVVVNAGGLATWQDGDDGDVAMADLGHWSGLATFYATNVPAAGDRALANLTYAWLTQPLTVGSVPATFVQIRPAHDDALALDYAAPVKAFQSSPIAIEDSSIARVTGAFADPAALDVPVAIARTTFAAAADAMHPSTCTHALQGERYWVHAVPGAGSHGELESGLTDDGIPDFGPRVVDDALFEAGGDPSGTLHVANPYPADWLYTKYAASFEVDCATADGRTPGNGTAEIGVITADLAGGLAPIVGPARAPHVDGHTVTWTAPEVGTPTAYELHLLQVSPSLFGGLTLQDVAELLVPGDVTSITLPPDFVSPGIEYAFRIRAVSRRGQSVAIAPFHAGIPLGYADLITEYFTP